jgi:hypothetical protein
MEFSLFLMTDQKAQTLSDVFKRLSEVEAPDARCLTVVTKTRTVDLMADTQAARDAWVEALTFAWHALR